MKSRTIRVSVSKAGPIGDGSHVPSLVLRATSTPSVSREGSPSELLEDARTRYQREALAIADALYECLPGGIVDYLFAELALRSASAFIVSRDAINQPQPRRKRTTYRHGQNANLRRHARKVRL
jgi:hypothetical protein